VIPKMSTQLRGSCSYPNDKAQAPCRTHAEHHAWDAAGLHAASAPLHCRYTAMPSRMNIGPQMEKAQPAGVTRVRCSLEISLLLFAPMSLAIGPPVPTA
jgi:hypothetical protein